MATNKIALQRVTLRELDPNLGNVLIVGIIIGKQRPRKFLNAKATVETYKAVWNFTFRDSPRDYINITCWGSCEEIFCANEKFHTGDVVEIVNPRISVRQISDYGEQYRPMVTCPFNLTLNERSAIVKHDGDHRNFLPLLNYPTKPIAGFLPIKDVHNNGATIKDNVDILGVVRGLRPVCTVTTRNGETLQVRTIEIFDHTSPSLKIEIWEPDIIKRSNNWKPRFTAIFLTDVQISYSNFEKSFVVKITSRTIVTENPQSYEVQMLLHYAKDVPLETYEIVDHLISNLPQPNKIEDVMSIKQVHEKIKRLQETTSDTKQFTALVYAVVSNLDLDGFSRTLTIKCGQCHVVMKVKGRQCENSECPTVFQNASAELEIHFDIRITLTDHTGDLKNCHFTGQAAERALHCTPRDFFHMSDDDKCRLKWQYLTERCAVRIAVLFLRKDAPTVCVINLSLANPLKVATKLPVC